MTYTVLESTGAGLEWLGKRQTKITASEGAIIVNLSPWQTPYELWKQKHALTITEDDIDLFYFAHALEAPIIARAAQKWPDEFGGRLRPSPGLIEWDEHPFIAATPDALVETDDEGDVSFQVKTVGEHNAKKWGEFKTQYDVPDQYRIQVIIENAVLGKPYGYLVPLVGNHTLVHPIRIDTDMEFLNWYLEQAEVWHQKHIVEKIAPEVTVGDDLVDMWPGNPGQKTYATAELVQQHRIRKLYMLQRSALEESDEHLKVDVARAMGDATELYDPKTDELLVTWRPKKSPARFNMPQFRADHPELIAEYSTPGKPERSMLFKDTRQTKADKEAWTLARADASGELVDEYFVVDTTKAIES